MFSIQRIQFNARNTLLPLTASLLMACSEKPQPLPYSLDADESGFGAATATTAAKHEIALSVLPFADGSDFENARRGWIATPEQLIVDGPAGKPIWDMPAYNFVEGEAPPSVHPSLWRQAKLNNIHGLFEVTEGIYQLRGFDLANLTLIDGEKGWIVVDPLTNSQTAAAAMRFAFEHLPARPISAVLFTHSHIDHFGGVLGALEAAGTAVEDVEVFAPDGFLKEATSENILAGPTMLRRAQYMYGLALPRSERGHVDTGLGKGPSSGSSGILPPTTIIAETGEQLTIDGVEFVFQHVPGSEAPAEFTFYLPGKKAFCGAELLSRNMHNLYTLRGAKVRDALSWAAYIEEARALFADAEVYFASHHWPVWGRDEVDEFLALHRDTYKFIHDQTLRYAFRGYTPREIAEVVELPTALQKGFSNRGYYGTTYHNVRAVYQFYFGWYDGNPANLAPLPPEAEAERYVVAMGGLEEVLKLADSAFEAGDYRWAATLLKHAVFANPESVDARARLAQSYEQLAYQAESGPWRDIYLTGAFELRNGNAESAIKLEQTRGIMQYASRSNFFNVMAARLDAEAAEGLSMVVNFNFTDLEENHVLTLHNSVLHHRRGPLAVDANVSLHITHGLFLDMVLGKASVKDLIFSDDLDIDGSRLDLAKFFSLQDKGDLAFNIVLP